MSNTLRAAASSRRPAIRCVHLPSRENELKLHNVAVRPLTPAARLDLRWTWGAPWRRTRLGLYTLRSGEWAHLEYNYRSGGYMWLYRHAVVNSALVTEAPTPRLFRDTPSTRRFRDLAHLW